MIVLDPAPGREVVFSLIEEVHRKGTGRSAETAGKVAVREPVILKLDEDLIGGDPILLAEYRRLSSEYNHYFVSFGCTFIPGQEETITSAEVEVQLDPGGGGNAAASIHSMRPDRVINSTEITSSATLGADFKLAKVGVGGEAKFDRESLFLVAYPAGSQGFWQFSETAQSAIAGQYPLQIVVRAPAAVPVSGWISVSFLLDRRRFFIISDQRRDEIARIGFTCS